MKKNGSESDLFKESYWRKSKTEILYPSAGLTARGWEQPKTKGRRSRFISLHNIACIVESLPYSVCQCGRIGSPNLFRVIEHSPIVVGRKVMTRWERKQEAGSGIESECCLAQNIDAKKENRVYITQRRRIVSISRKADEVLVDKE